MTVFIGEWSDLYPIEAGDDPPPPDPDEETQGPWSDLIPVGVYVPPPPEETIGMWSGLLVAPLFDPALVNPGVLLVDGAWIAHEMVWDE